MIHNEARIGKGTRIWHEHLSNIGNCIIGENCVIHSQVWIGDGVKIGNNVKIEAFAFIPPGVTLEDGVFVGPRVTFTNDKYPPSHGNWSETIVQALASIGAGTVVLPGITIGTKAVIGAGSVVTKSIQPECTAFGNPARVRKEYCSDCGAPKDQDACMC